MKIYIAPFQGYYSEALPTLAQLKRTALSRAECVKMNPGEQSLCQLKPIPHRVANHQECTSLVCGNTGKRNKEQPSFH